MKKKKIMFVLLSGILLASCERTITFDEAKNVASEIIKKIESKDFKAPKKLTGEIVAKDKEKGTEASIAFVTDEDNQYFYGKIESTEKNALTDKMVTTSIESWNYKDADKYISAASITTAGVSLKTYTYAETWAASYDTETFVMLSGTFLKVLADAKTEKDFIDVSAAGLETLTYKSSGNDNLSIEGSADKVSFKITIEKNMLTVLETDTETLYETYNVAYGKADIKKPDLSGFMKA